VRGNLGLVVTLAAAVTAVWLVACDPGDPGTSPQAAGTDNARNVRPGSPPPDASQHSPPVAAREPGLLPPWRLTGRVTAATVFIDLSASMQGFVRERSGPLSAVMSRLKDFLVREGISDISGAGFGTAVETPKPLGGPSELLAVPASETNTCLAGPLETAAQMDASVSKVLIVVTDGVASATAGACGQTCAAGTDVACVAKSLVASAERGIGVWLVGFRMPFEGSYYPELGARPFAAPAGTRRPIYLWILSPNLKVGRSLTSALTAWGQTSLREGNVLGTEVWPGRWLGYRVADQPNMGWRSSDFAAYEYAQATGVRSNDVASIHVESCSDATRRSPVAVPFLCLQQASGRLIWVGQVPIVAADGGENPDAAVPSLVKAVSALGSRADPVAAPRDKKEPAPSVRPGCLTPEGNPVNSQQVNLVNARWITGCVEPPPSTSPVRDRYRLLAALEFGTQGNAASIGVKWRVTSDLDALSPWSTEDDRTPATVGRTLGLSRLWGLVADIFAGEPKATELIQLGRSDGS
jgi:hypothetical protein